MHFVERKINLSGNNPPFPTRFTPFRERHRVPFYGIQTRDHIAERSRDVFPQNMNMLKIVTSGRSRTLHNSLLGMAPSKGKIHMAFVEIRGHEFKPK
jgi:hypothetical protein